jgi:hypothetical protein
MAKGSGIVRELIISFGFLNGVWLAIGVNPQNVILNFLKTNLESLDPTLKTLFIIIPIILFVGTVITVFKVYHHGGLTGAIAVFLAFGAGLTILTYPQYTAVLLIAAFVLGWLSFKSK